MTSPDVGLGTARPFQLVLHQVGVMGGGDKVMVERLPHVLVNVNVGGVENQAFEMGHVLQEAVFGHVLVLLGWICAKKKKKK